MRFATRFASFTTIAALAAIIVFFPPGPIPQAAAAQPAPELPADLALVPADAMGFVHIRGADLWKHEMFATFRQTFEKAGPKALASLDAQFVPKISTFDRATGFLLLDGERKEPVPIVVLRFTAAFDQDEVVKAYIPNAQKVTIGGKTAYGSREAGIAMYFPDKQHIVFGPVRGFETYLKHEAPKTGGLAYGLKLAATGKQLVGSINLSALPIPPKALEGLPPEVMALLKAEHITGSLELGATSKVELTAGYKNADDAQVAEKALKGLADYARKELAKAKGEIENKLFNAKGPRPVGELPEALFFTFALGALNQVDEYLAEPEKYVKRNGTNLTASLALPKDSLAAGGTIAAVGAGLLLPAVQKVRASAARMQSIGNLKQIAIAVHNYHEVYGHFPQDITDKNGKLILSWRVAILPFIEQDAVYKQFKLDEPWDSENNKKWSQLTIKTFLSPTADPQSVMGKTHYQGFVGPGTVFEPGKKIKFTDITDGTSNTIMVIETAEAVEWAKPGGIPFDPKKPLPKLPSAGGNDILLVAMCDGSVRTLSKSITEKTLKAAITRNGGEVLGDDW